MDVWKTCYLIVRVYFLFSWYFMKHKVLSLEAGEKNAAMVDWRALGVAAPAVPAARGSAKRVGAGVTAVTCRSSSTTASWWVEEVDESDSYPETREREVTPGMVRMPRCSTQQLRQAVRLVVYLIQRSLLVGCRSVLSAVLLLYWCTAVHQNSRSCTLSDQWAEANGGWLLSSLFPLPV